jgi:hypothetical protein
MRSKHLTTLIGLIVIAALFFSGGRPAAAQDGGGVGAQVAPPSNGSVAPTTTGVLYSQMDNSAGSGSVVNSQNNEGSDQNYCVSQFLSAHCSDTGSADDFVVPPGAGALYWVIDQIQVTGVYTAFADSLGNYDFNFHVDSVKVAFYNSAGTTTITPDVYCSPTNNAGLYCDNYVPIDTNGSFVINLTRPAVLPVGHTYWLMVQANLQLGLDSQGNSKGRNWSWGQRTVLTNNPSAWINLGGGVQPVCTTWMPRVSGCGVGNQPDLLFQLSGHIDTKAIYLPLIVKNP